jgi:hypothetical protein
MRASIHPAIRRIVWLIILIGASAVLGAGISFLFNLGPGITLPFTKAALDAGWLFVFGFMWLAIGLLLLWWLRPVPGVFDESNNAQHLEAQLRQSQTAQLDSLSSFSARLSDVEKAIQGISARLEAQGDAGANSQRPHDLDSELGSLATTIQDAHRRIDSLGDVNARLDNLESQLDALYVTLQDTHRRIDGLEQGNNR